MADLNLKLVISGSNDGAIAALNQVVTRAQASGAALSQADSSGTFGKTRAGVESISTQLARLQTLAGGAASGAFLLSLAKDALRAADELKGIEARLKLSSASWREYQQALVGVRDIAFQAGTAVAANVALINRISDPVKAMGGAQKDVLALTQAVNNSLRISNAGTVEGAAAMLQFSQAMGAGVLQGEELNSILENAPRLARAIADGLGVTVGELKNLGAQGALTSQQVFKAVQSQQAALAAEAARLPQTVGMAWTNLAESTKLYVSGVDKATGATSGLATLLNTVAKNLPAIGTALTDIAIVSAVAFGARQVAALMAYVVAQGDKAAATKLATRELSKQMDGELALRQAILRKTESELQAVAEINAYTLATNEAAAADRRRAAQTKVGPARQDVVVAGWGAAAAKEAAEAAEKTTLFSKALGGLKAVGSGVLSFFGGWPGLLVTGLVASYEVWDHFKAKSKTAIDQTNESLADMAARFNEFSGKSGVEESAKALSELKDKAAEARDKLASPIFRASEEGKKMAADLKLADEAIDQFAAKEKKFNDSHTKERGLLGLDKLKIDVGGLIGIDTQKQLDAFSTLYKDFVTNAVGDNNKLKASALEVKAALATLLSSAKTPAEFTGLITRVSDALKASPKDSTLQSTLEVAIEGRMQAEMKALNSLVSGLEARAQRTQALFSSSAQIALAQFNQAAALAKVAAELKGDGVGVSRIETNSRNAEVLVAQQAAALQVAALDKVATRKHELIAQGLKDAQASVRDEVSAIQLSGREKISQWEAEVAKGTMSKEQLADAETKLAKETTEKVKAVRATGKQAEADAIRQNREVDAETAQKRVAIAEGLYKTIQGKAAEALSSYKQYAQQVIQLDQKISTNRLDTSAAIMALQRTGMSPKDQVQSLREELSQLQVATADAMAAGQRDYALELLSRQKSLAQQIGQASGEGVDKKAQIAEGVDNLTQIGAQAEAILQEQRAAAAASAAIQLKSYGEMTTALNTLAKQITDLNANAAIKLKPEIEKSSLDAAISAVQNAFANVTIPVKVQATGLPTAPAANDSSLPARASGGELPGWAPHDTADNVIYRGTPGEWVIRRAAVRYYGAGTLAALNSMSLPKYATGGQLGGSVVNRLRVPSLSNPSTARGQPDVLDMGALGKVRMRKTSDTSSDVAAVLHRAALRFGKG
ncbi:tape measure protein [Quatrionicoccus australiensis]|uniref:tape measure protein n=1 Tax=Quatrionicoccus australiensis TaxID=138118 RepID=UPI001CF8A68B|nr:tape measure protein [Quatrionicoccus australiensis]UCV13763.1 tape measure protein [Quatrionicoccus australiensis]